MTPCSSSALFLPVPFTAAGVGVLLPLAGEAPEAASTVSPPLAWWTGGGRVSADIVPGGGRAED